MRITRIGYETFAKLVAANYSYELRQHKHRLESAHQNQVPFSGKSG